MYACICLAVTEDSVGEAVRCGAHDVNTLCDRTEAGTGCGGCLERLAELLQQHSVTTVRLGAAA